jgi:hypothetical protein
MEKKDTKAKKICHTDREFEELFLPGSLEKKKMQEAINEPEKLTDHLTKNIIKRSKK